MPQATEDLTREWYGPDDRYALGYLAGRGYELSKDWNWRHNDPDHEPTERDLRAMSFMAQEWDYGWFTKEEA